MPVSDMKTAFTHFLSLPFGVEFFQLVFQSPSAPRWLETVFDNDKLCITSRQIILFTSDDDSGPSVGSDRRSAFQPLIIIIFELIIMLNLRSGRPKLNRIDKNKQFFFRERSLGQTSTCSALLFFGLDLFGFSQRQTPVLG